MSALTYILTKRLISHVEARESIQRLINSHFQREPHARASIPALPDYDDDLIAIAYVEQQRTLTEELAVLRATLKETAEIADRRGKELDEAEIALKRKTLLLEEARFQVASAYQRIDELRKGNAS